jgi:hypothetical protein
VIGPGGVFLIDSKNLSERASVDGQWVTSSSPAIWRMPGPPLGRESKGCNHRGTEFVDVLRSRRRCMSEKQIEQVTAVIAIESHAA